MDCTSMRGRTGLHTTLWTAAVLATASLLPQRAQATVLLGQQTVLTAADSNSAGKAEAFRTTAGATGTVTSLTVFVDTELVRHHAGRRHLRGPGRDAGRAARAGEAIGPHAGSVERHHDPRCRGDRGDRLLDRAAGSVR